MAIRVPDFTKAWIRRSSLPLPRSEAPTTGADYPPGDAILFLELTRDRLHTQLEFIDAVDNKIGLLVSVASALMGGLAAIFALRSVQTISVSSAKTAPFGATELTTLALAGAAYLYASYRGLRAYFRRDWHTGAALNDVWGLMWKSDDERVLAWKIASTQWHCIKQNLAAEKEKADALPVLLGAVILQSVLVVLALALVAAGV